MPEKRPFYYTRGFVGLASLIGVTFLLVATIIGVNVVNDRNITLNMNNKAEDVYPSTCNVSLISSIGCGASGCTSTQMAQKWKTVTCDENVICVENANCKSSSPTPAPNCIGEGGTVMNGTAPCCSGLVKTDCVAAGSFSNCKCSKPTSPTATPSTRSCTVRTCLGTSCKVSTSTVPYSQACSPSNCVNDADCRNNIQITPRPTPTPTITTVSCNCVYGRLTGANCGTSEGMACSVASTPNPTSTPVDLSLQLGRTPTPSPSTCACENGRYVGACGHSAGYPCSEAPNVCEATTCNSKCASQVAGNIGTCVSGGCICSRQASKADGETCSDSNQCSSGNCSNTYINNVGKVVYLGTGYNICVPSLEEQDQSVVAQDKNAAKLGAAGAATAALTVGGAYVIPEISALAAANGGLSAIPNAVYSYGTAAITTLPASVQTTIAVTGTGLGLFGAGAGTVACVENPYSDACTSYVGALQGDPTAMIQLGQSADNLIATAKGSATFNSTVGLTKKLFNKVANKLSTNPFKSILNSRYLQNSIEDSFSWANNSWSPSINGIDEAQSYYYGYVNPNKLAAATENKLVKALTGYDIDNPMVNTVLANDASIVRQKYNLPSAYLRKEDPLEYQAQLLKLAKDNNIDIITQNETTFFNNNDAVGVAFDSQDYINTTIAYQTSGSVVSQNEILEHEIVHGIQLQKYPRSAIEIKEYEAYLTSFNPDKIEGNLTPAYLDYVAGANWMQSIDSFYSQNGLASPTSFEFLNTLR